MRFKKGSKVEVLRQKSPGAWYSAEIISGNGHTYSVRYEYPSAIDGNTILERVSRKAIRPCPPPVSLNDLVTGALAEAFISGVWKVAVILNVLSGGCYLVRLVGSLEECKAHKPHIRPRQTWKNGEWFVTGKIGSNLRQIGTRSELKEGIAYPSPDKTDFERYDLGSSRTLKRSHSSCSSHIGTYPIKVRRVEKESRSKQIISRFSFPFSDKVIIKQRREIPMVVFCVFQRESEKLLTMIVIYVQLVVAVLYITFQSQWMQMLFIVKQNILMNVKKKVLMFPRMGMKEREYMD